MSTAYIEKRDGGYWIRTSRVSLDSIVYGFWNGQTPESLAQDFPVLSLEEIYGAIAYYLAHRTELDAYLQEQQRDFEKKRDAARESDPRFYLKLSEAKRNLKMARS